MGGRVANFSIKSLISFFLWLQQIANSFAHIRNTSDIFVVVCNIFCKLILILNVAEILFT